MTRAGLALVVAAAGCGRIGFDPASGDGAPAPDATITGPCAGTTMFTDGFDDTMPEPTFEITQPADLTVIEVASELRIVFDVNVAAAHYAGYRTLESIAAEGICAQAEVSMLPDDKAGSYFKMFDVSRTIEFFLYPGAEIEFRTQQDLAIGFDVTAPYDLATMRFLRFRVINGTTYWDTSSDGVSYYQRASLPEFYAGRSGRLELGAGSAVAVNGGGTAAFASASAFRMGSGVAP
jgi:hypothetical protein